MTNIFSRKHEVDMISEKFYVTPDEDSYGLKKGKKYICLDVFSFSPGHVQLMIVGENNKITFSDLPKVTFVGFKSEVDQSAEVKESKLEPAVKGKK